jgi:hypothetical protein
MSLDVPPALLDTAKRGDVSDRDFVSCVRDSLPYAWHVVETIARDLQADGGDVARHAVPPPSESERGQLLRAMASDAIRGALERHFGVTLAFQNCHAVAAFSPLAIDGPAYRAFVSPRGQILNQDPSLRDC